MSIHLTEAPATATRTRMRPRVVSIGASILAVLALVLFGGVGAASATSIVSVSPAGPYSGATSVTVSGTGTPGNYVSVTECNSTLGGLTGTYCNHAAPTSTAFKTVLIPASGAWTATITVRPTFANWNYQTNSANTGTTNCRAAGTQCQIQVSEYTSNPPTGAPVGAAGTNITFN
ncbi:neocarzinostatin apoprotein domain-containing protein [Herbiconiux sp. P18]|uniref:neocarzinostatin apoprotein domain-containing protein n=1 Tax=Herbiconiux liangxiaofengii TaxID=3342795 RepID=UPI0035B7226A